MARIIIIGGGVVGLGAAIMLADDGNDVTVLERDPSPPPGDPDAAWNDWERRGVNQFRMLHFFLGCYQGLMREHVPAIVDAFTDSGAIVVNPLRDAPVEMTGGFRDGDERFDALTARRPVAESAVARVAAATNGLTVRRGVAVAGLITGDGGASGIPHVVGVRTDDGDELRADVVVDSSGRRSSLPSLLEAIGARPPIEELADSGFVYYGRHFRSPDGSVPFAFGPPHMTYESYSTLTLPADNGTWGVGIITSAGDAPLRRLKDVDAWERVLKGTPLVAHWMDGEPISDGVAVMAKIEDRHRSFVVDGLPVATGILPLGDSWACTNPSVGRGVSIGTMHAVALRMLLRDAPADPVELAQAWHDATMATVEPWYRDTVEFDEGRLAEMDAQINGDVFEPDEGYATRQAMQAAAGKDPDVLRALLAVANAVTLPQDVLADAALRDKVMTLGANWRDEPLPGLSRADLLAAVAG